MKRSKKQIIAEKQLRNFIKIELSRQAQLDEGFLDLVKSTFLKLQDKSQDLILKKLEETITNLSGLSEKFKNNLPDGFFEFLKLFKEANSGNSLLASSEEFTEELSNLQGAKEELQLELFFNKNFLIQENTKISYEKAKFEINKIEEESYKNIKLFEKAELKKEAVGETIISGIAALANAWWISVKAAISVLGALNIGCKLLSFVMKRIFKREELSKKFESYSNTLQSIETKILKKFVYPAPISYAAHVAACKLKGEKILSFRDYNSPQNLEEKKAAEKLVHAALISALIAEAIAQLLQGLLSISKNSLSSIKKVAQSSTTIRRRTKELVTQFA